MSIYIYSYTDAKTNINISQAATTWQVESLLTTIRFPISVVIEVLKYSQLIGNTIYQAVILIVDFLMYLF